MSPNPVVSQRPENWESTNKKLPEGTSLGYIHLTISDMQRSVDFYQNILGFQIHKQEAGKTILGAGGTDLLVLSEITGAVRVPRTSGLYHFAILTPSRRALAKSLRRLIETETGLQGGADHLVSEALYLADPDGNGIEIYRDRPRSEWQFENGLLKMATEALDYQDILNEDDDGPREWNGLDPGTRIGHIHLHVADLSRATEFYERILGFDFILSYMGSASFLSAGGYHHHIGLNTWNGVGVPAPPPDMVGLRHYTIQIASQIDQQNLVERLRRAEVDFRLQGEELILQDPSGNGVRFLIEHR